MEERKLYYPSHELKITQKIIYLAGPIGDAPPWHQQAIRILNTIYPEKLFAIASPHEMIDTPEDSPYDYQIDWEDFSMEKSTIDGCLLFWFPLAANLSKRAYAQTSRLELGIALKQYQTKKFNLVIGADYGFDGEYYLHYKMKKLGLHLFRTLEETCEAAVKLI